MDDNKKPVECGVEINKDALIHQLMEERHYLKASAKAVVEDFTGMILDNLERGNVVNIHGFGIFEIVEAAPHKSTDPNTGEPQIIPKHWRFRFRHGAKIKRAMKRMNNRFKIEECDS